MVYTQASDCLFRCWRVGGRDWRFSCDVVTILTTRKQADFGPTFQERTPNFWRLLSNLAHLYVTKLHRVPFGDVSLEDGVRKVERKNTKQIQSYHNVRVGGHKLEIGTDLVFLWWYQDSKGFNVSLSVILWKVCTPLANTKWPKRAYMHTSV